MRTGKWTELVRQDRPCLINSRVEVIEDSQSFDPPSIGCVNHIGEVDNFVIFTGASKVSHDSPEEVILKVSQSVNGNPYLENALVSTIFHERAADWHDSAQKWVVEQESHHLPSQKRIHIC